MIYSVSVLENQVQEEGEMAITGNQGYVKRTMADFLGLLMAPSATLAESKFLSLVSIP